MICRQNNFSRSGESESFCLKIILPDPFAENGAFSENVHKKQAEA